MLDILKDFNERSRPKTAEGKNEKINTYNCEYGLYEGWELVLNAFRSEIFPITTQGKGLRKLSRKKRLQRLPLALA